jgi:exosortase A
MNTLGRIATADAADTLPGSAVPRPRWGAALVALGLGLAAWAALFHAEITAAVGVWNSSTAYNHCWLILPIAAWLAWQRRERLAVLAPEPAPLFALLALPGAIAWLAAERLGVMEGRQLVAMGLLWVLVLAVLGWRFSLAFAGPLAYLIFLVPFGGFAVGPLQHLTARMIDWGLDLVGITHYVDGLMIETTAGMFHVAEACAGLRFIIAALAFGALYALVIFRSPWRRLIVMALALAVPILANGVRALGIIVLAEYLGSAEAAAADHIIYGWGFFSFVILLLILAGLPFREDAAPPAAPRFPSRPGTAARPARLAAALLLAAGLAAAGPGTAAALAWRSGEPEERPLRLAAPEGCVQAADGLGLACEGMEVSARMLVFSASSSWRAVSEARWRLGGLLSDTAVVFSAPIAGGGSWQARQDGDRSSATAAWLDGRAVGDGFTSRVAQARNSLLGGGGRPVFVVVNGTQGAEPLPSQRERALFQAVLAAQADLVAEAAARSRED